MTRNDFLVLIAAAFLAVILGLFLADILFDTGLGVRNLYEMITSERVVNVETSAGRQSEEGRVSQDSITDTDPDISSLGFSTITAEVTAFNTVEEQTDDRPCESASGDWICGRDDVVACPPEIPFYTWVGIPIEKNWCYETELYISGEPECKIVVEYKDFECLDHTASKYSHRFDISYDKDIDGAWEWGNQTLEIKIYK